MADLLFHCFTIYYYLPNITRSLRVSIFHSLECFFSVCSSCFKIPYNVSFTHLHTFSTTLAMKSKIEHRGTILVKDLIKKNMSFQNVWHKGFSDVKKTSLHSVMEGFQSRIRGLSNKQITLIFMMVSFFLISTPTLAHMRGKNKRPKNECIVRFLAGHCTEFCLF